MTPAELSEGLDKWDHNLSGDAMDVIDDVIDKTARAVALLKRIEWGGSQGDEDCPECHGWRFDGHAPGCELAALIGGK